MASLLTLRRRIKVAGNIAKTTRAMQMVAASKMRRAQENALKGRPYGERLTHIMGNLRSRVEDYSHSYFASEANSKPLIIIFSPDKGLCGALISNLARELINFPEFKKAAFIIIGKKLARFTKENLIADFSTGGALPGYEQIPPLVSAINTGLIKDFGKVYVLYAKFLSFFTQKATIEQILPIEASEKIETPTASYLFEPNPNAVIDSLLPHYLETKLYQMLLENYASEQAARMLAMQNATENAQEVIELLTLEYNKVRQAKITNEILDNTRASLAITQI